MKTFFKIIILLICVLISLLTLNLNIKQYYKPDYQGLTNIDILNQLKFLKEKIHENTGEEMQKIYPEGFFFMNVIYGLTWTDLLKNKNLDSKIYHEGISEINFALKQLNSEKGKEIFTENLSLNYGAYYQGWKNLLLASKIEILKVSERDSTEIKEFLQNCNEISEAFQNQDSPYLESYPNGIWQCDNLICMTSLAIHDKIFDKKYKVLREEWIEKVKRKLDKKTGLIPHSVSPEKEGARGSSQSLMLCYLPLIDSVFAKEQFVLFQKYFLEKRLGLTGIREYPTGISGNGDIDSGPVIWEIGGVSSIVGVKTLVQNNDFENAIAIRNNIEGLLFPTNYQSKKYIFGKLPMVDVFIAWSNTNFIDENIKNSNNNFLFHLISFLILLFCLLILKFIFKK